MHSVQSKLLYLTGFFVWFGTLVLLLLLLVLQCWCESWCSSTRVIAGTPVLVLVLVLPSSPPKTRQGAADAVRTLGKPRHTSTPDDG
jgi:hypothetical protein